MVIPSHQSFERGYILRVDVDSWQTLLSFLILFDLIATVAQVRPFLYVKYTCVSKDQVIYLVLKLVRILFAQQTIFARIIDTKQSSTILGQPRDELYWKKKNQIDTEF